MRHLRIAFVEEIHGNNMLHYCCLCRVETIIDVSSLMISGLPKHLPDCQGRERLQQKFNLLRRECCGPEVILFLALKYIFSSVMSQNILTKSKSAVRIKKTNNYRVIEEYLVRVCWQLNRMEKKKPSTFNSISKRFKSLGSDSKT